MDDLRGQMSPKVVHSSPDLPRLSYGSGLNSIQNAVTNSCNNMTGNAARICAGTL